MKSSSIASKQLPSGPLHGLRVVEAGQLLAGPYCGQLLGDYGADVVKLEDPVRGDPMRQWGQEQAHGQSLWWPIIGRNKRSVGCDLRSADGQDLARRLLAEADIFVENFRPGTLERWGLGYEELAAINPRLIMVRVSGFGQTGPYATRPGYASIGEAMGGLRYVVGEPDRPPARCGISLGDSVTGMFGCMGAMAALQARTVTGRGQVVDAAISESILALMESLLPEWAVAGHRRERSGSKLPNIAPSNAYATADGIEVVIAANQDTVFARLATAMGQPELATDERFATHAARGTNADELDRIINVWSVTLSVPDLIALLEDHSVPVGKIYRAEDILVDPQFLAREAILEIDYEDMGKIPMQGVFPKFSETPGTVRFLGARLGEHTQSVREEVGSAPAAGQASR